MTYRLIILDCVNTLLLPDHGQIPRIEVDGVETPSTAPHLLPLLRPHLPALEAVPLHQALRAAWRWAAGERGPEHREVPARERFAHLLGLLGGGDLPPALAPTLADDLLEAHMRLVVGCFNLPPAHLELLQRLKGRFRLALFSNFDHTASLLGRLEELGVAGFFDPLIISEALGWRKPGQEAFARVLAQAGVAPEQALMVGDSHEDDVVGAHAVGMDVAWINPKGAPAPEPQPQHTLAGLHELERILP